MPLIFLILLAGCQSSPPPRPPLGIRDYDQKSKAAGEAYVIDAMTIRKPMTNSAPDWKPTDFYFKECNETGPRFYYSKTGYDCTYP